MRDIGLFTFQQEDVDYLDGVPHALIANEMGTGKTYEAIARDLNIRATDTAYDGPIRTLVVAPLSVLSSWKEHIQELLGEEPVVVDRKARHRFFDEDAKYYLVHWDALRLMPELRTATGEQNGPKWLHVIADECHRMKNRKAKQTKALKSILARYKTAMSGTPVVNRPDELWSILNWLYPEDFGAFWAFYKRFVEYEIIYPQGYHKTIGAKNPELLREAMKPFTVRRRKEDVLPDLPNKYYTKIWVDLDSKQRRAYDQMKSDLIAWVGEHEDNPLVAPVVIAQLIRLQQFALAYCDVVWYEDDEMPTTTLVEPSSKLDALLELLADRGDEQVVVFSQFKRIWPLLKARLDKAGIEHVHLTGDVAQEDREAAIRRFQGGDARVFFGTIQAGGIGITLTAASTVVFLDRSWSPATNQQAEDRLHRIGQRSAVEVIDIMAKNTIDLGRAQRLEMKWAWIKAILDG